MSTTSFLIRKDQLPTTRLHTATDQPLADGRGDHAELGLAKYKSS